MPYLMGVLTGVLLTVLVVFLVDNLAVANAPSGTEPQKIVNWDVAAQKLRSSITTMKQEVREVPKTCMRRHAEFSHVAPLREEIDLISIPVFCDL
jgi:hypothetical protein